MKMPPSPIGELCDRVSAGDPEAERRFEKEYTTLLTFLIRRSQVLPAACTAAACSFAGERPLTTPDEAQGQSKVELLAQRICRRAIGKLQEGRRKTRHDTVGGRGGWLTIRF